jgi:S-adenosylmethionine synthetase
MFEKTSCYHPDKVADRIAGAVVDHCYTHAAGGWLKSNPRVAVETLIGHSEGLVIIETSEPLRVQDVSDTVRRISGIRHCTVRIVPQDPHLARNQEGSPRVGDNGIAKGMPVTPEQRELTALIRTLDENFHSDAKAVLTPDRLIVCQSNASYDEVFQCIQEFVRHNGYGKTIIGGMTPAQITINPLGPWTGGLDADSGATNRKLGSDMGDAVTGGGLAGKDLSKADVSCQIVAHMLAQQYHTEVRAAYAIGDEQVTYHIGGHGQHFPDTIPDAPDLTLPFADIIERARLYVHTQFGSFEKFAEYGLIA